MHDVASNRVLQKRNGKRNIDLVGHEFFANRQFVWFNSFNFLN